MIRHFDQPILDGLQSLKRKDITRLGGEVTRWLHEETSLPEAIYAAHQVSDLAWYQIVEDVNYWADRYSGKRGTPGFYLVIQLAIITWRALACRDQLSARHYDIMTGLWRRQVGRIHPDDKELS